MRQINVIGVIPGPDPVGLPPEDRLREGGATVPGERVHHPGTRPQLPSRWNNATSGNVNYREAIIPAVLQMFCLL